MPLRRVPREVRDNGVSQRCVGGELDEHVAQEVSVRILSEVLGDHDAPTVVRVTCAHSETDPANCPICEAAAALEQLMIDVTLAEGDDRRMLPEVFNQLRRIRTLLG